MKGFDPLKVCDRCGQRTSSVHLSGAWESDGRDHDYCTKCWAMRRDAAGALFESAQGVGRSARTSSMARLTPAELMRVSDLVGSTLMIGSAFCAYCWLCTDQIAKAPFEQPSYWLLFLFGWVFFMGWALRRFAENSEGGQR